MFQVWTDQKNVKPNPSLANITTKEFFEREKQQTTLISGKALNDVRIIIDVIFMNLKLIETNFFKQRT